MALAQVTIMANQVESARIGHQAISLTEFASNLEPEIAAGSVVEVGGALYEAAADEAIAGLAAIAPSSDVYIKLTVAGASVTASGTVVAPTWDTAKQGWYSGAERYIGGLYKDAGGNYTLKWLYEFMGVNTVKLFGDGTVGVWDGLGWLAKKVIEIGNWDMDAAHAVSIAHGLTVGAIRDVRVTIRDDAGNDVKFTPAAIISPIDGSLGTEANLYHQVSAGNIIIARRAGGSFDSAGWNATPYNRGWIMIEYEV